MPTVHIARCSKVSITVAESEIARAAIDIMSQKLEEPIGLDELSRLLGMEKFKFFRQFKKVTGTTPHTFLAALRMERAKHLLALGGAITEVSACAGYESLGTFSHTFHRLVGYSPVQLVAAIKSYRREDFFSDSLNYARHERERIGIPIEGRISVPQGVLRGIYFVGAFARSIPKGKPLAGCILLGPGRFRFIRPSIQSFFIFALWLPYDIDPFFPPRDTILGARLMWNSYSASTFGGQDICLDLRHLTIFDPPIVVALPSLLAI